MNQLAGRTGSVELVGNVFFRPSVFNKLDDEFFVCKKFDRGAGQIKKNPPSEKRQGGIKKKKTDFIIDRKAS